MKNDKEIIEELKQENKALEWENQLLKTIMDCIHEGVFVTNANGEIILYNRVVEKTEGMKREEVLGRREEDVYSFSSEYFFHETVTNKVRKTGKSVVEQHYEYSLPDGRKTSILFSTFPFYYKGQISAVYTVGRNVNQIGEFIAKTLEMQKKLFREENNQSHRAKYLLEDIIGISEKICEAVLLARKVATHKSPVLIIGETGTGKELFAHGIHNASLYAKGPFVPINCAAIPETLLESVLFGTVKGAFTGAVDIPGLFEQAEGGTIFLDEINSMPFPVQAKLLRVLQDKVIRRIGSTMEIPVNCKIVSATNVDPFRIENEKIIRPDLFFRLATVAINIPPLRERKEDIKVLCANFIKKYNREFGLFVEGISDALIELFEKYHWPGNVRELENIIESGMNCVDGDKKTLKLDHIPVYFRNRIRKLMEQHLEAGYSGELHKTLADYEKKFIEQALKKNQGNISKTADDLGIWRQNLHYRIKKFGIEVRETP